MEVLKIADSRVVLRVLGVLRKGGVCAVPTDTVYGLIADATNEKAVRKIFEIKGRPKEKAVSLFVRDIRMAKKYGEISPAREKFLEKIWPGAVTAVLELRMYESNTNVRMIPNILTGERRTVGMRVPKDEFLQKILKEMGAPLAQTSANISGKPPARNAEEVIRYFERRSVQPNLVVDGGECGGEPSTVIDLSGREPKILRESAVSRETVFRWYTYF